MKKLTKKVKAVRNSLNQEIKTWPKWTRVIITILLTTGFFLTAAFVAAAVRTVIRGSPIFSETNR